MDIKELHKNLKEEWDEGLFFYSKLPIEDFTNMRCQILFDTNKSYMAYNHKPCVFIWNGYTNDCKDFITISISNNPEILYMPKKLNIYKEDLHNAINYIQENYIVFLNAAYEKVGLFDTIDILLGLNESYNTLKFKPKMHVLKPHETGLPFKIWIDSGNTWKTKSGHGPRIKIEVPNEKRTDNWVSVSIPDGNLFNNISNGKSIIKNEYIKLVKKYIKFNHKLLEKIIESSCNIIFYKENSIKLDIDGNPIYPKIDNEPDYILSLIQI